MKAVIVLLCLLAVSGAFAADNCYNDVSLDCSQSSPNPLTLASCNAIYGSYGHGNLALEMQAYANLHLEKSYDYLLSAAYYNNYQTNRGGFSKLFKKLSDDTWQKTIELIKHVTKRGGVMDFSRRSGQEAAARKNYTVELHEIESIARALDTQKEIADRAFYIHREATRNSQHLHDPEIAQYLEEEFIEYHANSIRELAGHARDIKSFISENNGQDLSLALYLFDLYLQKTA